jgi:hypothetical protein
MLMFIADLIAESKSLIDEFVTDFIRSQEWLTDFLLAEFTIGKKREKVVAHLPFVSPVIARRFGERAYLIQERPLLIRQIEKVMSSNDASCRNHSSNSEMQRLKAAIGCIQYRLAYALM